MNNPLRFTFFLAIALILSARIICAQTNPTGVSGQFYGDITTGCNYDPFTGSARREILDVTVVGAVGSYPLSFGRTSTSRYDAVSPNPPIATYFGPGGSWRHSYQWSIDDNNSSGNGPHNYIVNYPDGRRIAFDNAGENGNDTYWRRVGVRDRLELGGIVLYLHLPDGGKVGFSYSAVGRNPTTYHYKLQSITDPYGQVTNVTYPADGNTLITEPAGRWIKIFFRTITLASEGNISDKVIDHITASDGRSVQYSYTAFPGPNSTIYTTLTQATYFGDSTLKATYTYQPSNILGTDRPLLGTADDPMAGPMKKISYSYVQAIYGHAAPPAGFILSENSGTTGQVVTTLDNSVSVYSPTEIRADGKTRSFSYGPNASGFNQLNNWTDFKGVSMSQTYDTRSFVNSFTDRRGNTTNWTNDILSGRITSITYPLTPNDTPTGTPRGTETFVYGSATCPDPNNRDATNPYYLYSHTDEGGHTTVYLRDANKRITQINYPDGGSESFTYNSFGQVLTHLMKTGGTESFTYDARGLKQTYRDAYHQTGNPSAWYQYDALDRVSGVTDALGSAAGDINHTTNFTYNSRGQVLVTTHPVDPVDGLRHTIQNGYNSNNDGTLVSITDQLMHVTSFSYDDYRRLRSMTSPGHNSPVTAYTYYDANGTGEDYTHTDSNVTHATAPGGEKITNAYDENYRKISTIIADGTSDAAKTTFGYDNNGNLTSLISPNEQPGQLYAGKSTVTAYDERNRLMSMTDPLLNVTTFKYDAAGRKASVTRANGQVITYDSYDAMNRLLQQTAKQTPDPDAVTKYTYYTWGLLHTMQDPRLVANNSADNYNYTYDQMGRKTGLTYPLDSLSVHRTESWHYDTAGRNDTFTNRDGKVQTFSYDNLNRQTGFTWNDGLTPSVTFGYDAANRMTRVVNANATIARAYFNDNLLNTETATYADNIARTVTYTYNADGNRATIQYPNAVYSFTYNYTGRNQLWKLINNSGGATVMTFGYDPESNLTMRTPANATTSSYTYDALDRVTHITHALVGTTRTFDYAYDSVGNRKWTKRDGANGDVFGYDLNDQSIAILLNIANPDTTPVGPQKINYDANGNLTTFSAYGPTDTYTTNNLNQYTARNANSALYDTKGNLITGVDGSTYTYDAQNRLLSATKSGTTSFKYDGLNRQVSRQIGANPIVYNIYDGWNLIGEYASGASSPTVAYLGGAGGLAKNLTTNRYYYQDASGSTSHYADSTGHLLEWYRYDLQGTPIFSGGGNSSAFGVRHLFTGQQWYSEIGLYDLRNRFYSPDTGRFVQTDPIGFAGDPSNLYRYCGNGPVTRMDALGLYQNTVVAGYYGGVMITWGNNGGQSNFGAYVGPAYGASWSYVSSDSGATSQGFVPGMAAQATLASGTFASVDVNANSNARGADVSVVGSIKGPAGLSTSGGINLDNNGNLTAAPPTFTIGAALFAGFGGTWFGAEPAFYTAQMLANISNGAFDAAAVEEELAAASNTFQDPSSVPALSQGFLNDVGLSLTNFGGVTGGGGVFGAGGSFGIGGGGGNPTGLWGDPSGDRGGAGGPVGAGQVIIDWGGQGGKKDPPPHERQ